VSYDEPMIHPHIAPFLPANVWTALQRVSHHIGSLPIQEGAQRFYLKDVEKLTARLILASKQHDLTFPTGEHNARL
jgi:hypothetical protein